MVQKRAVVIRWGVDLLNVCFSKVRDSERSGGSLACGCSRSLEAAGSGEAARSSEGGGVKQFYRCSACGREGSVSEFGGRRDLESGVFYDFREWVAFSKSKVDRVIEVGGVADRSILLENIFLLNAGEAWELSNFSDSGVVANDSDVLFNWLKDNDKLLYGFCPSWGFDRKMPCVVFPSGRKLLLIALQSLDLVRSECNHGVSGELEARRGGVLGELSKWNNLPLLFSQFIEEKRAGKVFSEVKEVKAPVVLQKSFSFMAKTV